MRIATGWPERRKTVNEPAPALRDGEDRNGNASGGVGILRPDGDARSALTCSR